MNMNIECNLIFESCIIIYFFNIIYNIYIYIYIFKKIKFYVNSVLCVCLYNHFSGGASWMKD